MTRQDTQFKKGQRPSINTEFKKGCIPSNKKDAVLVVCKQCKKDFNVQPYRQYTAIFCSPSCRALFNFQKEKHPQWKGGLPSCLDCGKKLSNYNNKKCSKCHILRNKNHPRWIEDRTLLKGSEISQERRSIQYKDWRRQICNRDKWKCRILNSDCKGRLEVHHILGFTEHPELRYEINNGITLCKFHHPRRRIDEINLSPYFQSLVMNVK